MIVAIMTTALAGTVKADTVTIPMNQQGWTDASAIGSGILKDDTGTNTSFNFSSAQGEASNAPAYYNSGTNVRFYSKKNGTGNGGSMTITPAANTGITITGIVLTASSNYTPTTKYNVDGGSDVSLTWDGTTGTVSGISATKSFKFRNANAANNTNQLRITQIEITYTVSAPSYTITAQSNNSSYGTVSLIGNVITGSPNSGYRYASPAYSVSPANSATVSQSGNEFTVTPSANTTVTINFEAIPTYTVTLGDDNSTLTETTGGAGVTLPSRNAIGSYTFAGWSTENVATETTTAPTTIIPAGTYNPTGNITLYPVYTRAGGGAATPSPFSVGDTGDYAIVSAEQNGKYYALPTNPTVSSGKITAEEITVSETDDVKYVTTANASGFTWTIAAATNGYTLSDGSKYVYHSNGGASGTNLAYGNATNLTWAFSEDGNYVTMAGMNGDTTNDRGMLFQGTTIGGYSLQNATASGYYKVMILPISAGSTTYYWSNPVAATVEQPVITVAANPFLFSTTATITCDTDGATIKYSYDNSAWNDYSSALTITETTTIYAKAIKDENESTVASVEVTKNLANPNVTVSGDLTLDLDGETNVSAGTLTAAVTYENAAVPSATVTWSGNNNAVATIDASTGAVTLLTTGTVTFTATYAGNSDYAEATGTKTITVVDNKAPGSEGNPYTVADVIALNPTSTSEAVKTDVYVKGYIIGAVDGGTGELKNVDESNSINTNLAIADNPTETTNYCTVQLPNNAIRAALKTEGKTYNIGVAQILVKGNIKKYCGKPGVKDLSEGSKVAEYVKVTSAGYATYCTDVALNFAGTGITAYVGTIDSNKQLTFTPNNQAPANTGLLLKGSANTTTTATVPVITSASAVNDNCLTGTVAGTDELTANDYILNKVNDGVGFYKAGSYTTLGAHKAYIPAAVGNGVKGFVINLDDDATGISLMEDGRSQMEDGAIYNLAGQRLNKMQKGINIVNGKKILK